MSFVVPVSAVTAIPVAGQLALFPVHRIYCVGRNYEDHAREMGATGREPPFFFLKPADAACHSQSDTPLELPYPGLTNNLHHEIELVVAIGKGGSAIEPANALEHVFGYAVGLDMTRRDLQNDMKKQGRPWCIGKAFEMSAPIGTISPADAVPHIQTAAISLDVNGETRQSSSINNLIWSVAETIAQISLGWTLQPGDLIYTGTPAGVGAVKPGDILHGKIDGLNDLRVRIL